MSFESSASMPLFAGKYRLIRMLGKGAMGEVWLAEEEGPRNFRRRVAVKRLLGAGELGDYATDSFLAEAQVIAKLDHPNIVRLIELGSAEQHLYLVLEFVDGAALDRIYKRTGAMSPAAVAFLGREVARALEAVHELCDEQGRNYGVVHRDVTPSNILLSREGRVRLSDFGVARISGLGGEKTETGVFKGKLPYMPPEQGRGEPFDGRADIFALGITLFEGLLGRRLRKAETQTQLLMMIASEPVQRVHELLPHVPPALAQAIDRACELHPRNRTENAGELAMMLDDALRALGPTAVKEAQAELKARVEQVAGAPAGGPTAPSAGRLPQPNEWSVPLGTNAGAGPSGPSGPSPVYPTSLQPQRHSSNPPPGFSSPPPAPTGATRISAPPTNAGTLGSTPPGSNPSYGRVVTNVAHSSDAGMPSSLGPRSTQRRSLLLPAIALAGFTVLGGVAAFLVLSRSASGPRSDQAATSAPSSAPAAATTSTPQPSTTSVEAVASAAPTNAATTTTTTTAALAPGPLPKTGDPKRPGTGGTSAPSATAEESNEPGTLVVSVSPWADVSVDGRSAGTTPLAPISLPPGPHSVVLRNSELGASRSTSVTIKPGKSTQLRVDLRRSE